MTVAPDDGIKQVLPRKALGRGADGDGQERGSVFRARAGRNLRQEDGRTCRIKDALHLAAQVSFLDLPYDSRILCVGAGTGAEVLALAEKNPGWRFTALDPSEAMLEVCRDKLSRKGLLDRCDFHHGYIESLPPERRYHAATSILVSQFLTERAERVAFFRQIARHLTDGGHLLTADLAR